jgi:glucokinase
MAVEDANKLAYLFEPLELARGPAGIPTQLVRMLGHIAAEGRVDISSISAVGIGATGPLDEIGLVNPTNLPFDRVPLIAPIHDVFPTHIVLKGDCTAAVLGEAIHGAGRTIPLNDLNMAYMNIGTGIGVGVLLDGCLIEGAHGNAGELGHLTVDTDGIKCGCGHYGCAEAYASGVGLAKNARLQLLNEDFKSLIYELALRKASLAKSSVTWSPTSPCEVLPYVDAEAVFIAAREGDRLGRKLVEQAIQALGLVLAAIGNAFNPELVTVGGNVGLSQANVLLPGVIEEMNKHIRVSAPEVVITKLGDRSVLYGALELARQVTQHG